MRYFRSDQLLLEFISSILCDICLYLLVFSVISQLLILPLFSLHLRTAGSPALLATHSTDQPLIVSLDFPPQLCVTPASRLPPNSPSAQCHCLIAAPEPPRHPSITRNKSLKPLLRLCVLHLGPILS